MLSLEQLYRIALQKARDILTDEFINNYGKDEFCANYDCDVEDGFYHFSLLFSKKNKESRTIFDGGENVPFDYNIPLILNAETGDVKIDFDALKLPSEIKLNLYRK